jgi:hypothetical protein
MKPKKVDAPRVKPDNIAGFLNILRESHGLPAEEVERLRESASGAIRRDPGAIFSICKASLQDRGIDEPQSGVYVFVLLDGLISLRVVAEIDWRSPQEDVIWAIEQISAETEFALDPIAHRDTASTLSAIGAVIDRRGKRLLQWKTDSDSYCVMVVKHQFVDEAIRAASRLKIILTPKIR